MEPLQVVRTDFYCKENAKAHHTDEYDLVKADPPTPVLRRGANFAMAIQFNRAFNPDFDVIRVRFEFGKYVTIEVPIFFYFPHIFIITIM